MTGPETGARLSKSVIRWLTAGLVVALALGAFRVFDLLVAGSSTAAAVDWLGIALVAAASYRMGQVWISNPDLSPEKNTEIFAGSSVRPSLAIVGLVRQSLSGWWWGAVLAGFFAGVSSSEDVYFASVFLLLWMPGATAVALGSLPKMAMAREIWTEFATKSPIDPHPRLAELLNKTLERARAGDRLAQFDLAHLYLVGAGGMGDLTSAMAWLMICSEPISDRLQRNQIEYAWRLLTDPTSRVRRAAFLMLAQLTSTIPYIKEPWTLASALRSEYAVLKKE